eukprot:scaffold8.g1362.t1
MVRRASVHTTALNEDMESMSEEQLLLEWGRQEARRCDDGDPDLELCELPEIRNTAPVERNALDEAWSRGRWLLGLLLLQSLSSFVLDSYQQLLKDHLVVTLFLTMLVGAGGNAGNQSAIKVIRGLATGSIEPTRPVVIRVMQQQAAVGLLLGAGLSAGGFARVLLTTHSVTNSLAISISLFLIVICSVLAGTGLPFALTRAGIDPANAGTSIQVFMDVLGFASFGWRREGAEINSKYGPGVAQFAADPTGGSASVLRLTYPGGAFGSGSGMNLISHPYPNSTVIGEEARLQYKVWFAPDFDWAHGGKLPGLYSGDASFPCTGGGWKDGCWSVRLMWREGGKGESYSYVPPAHQTCELAGAPGTNLECDPLNNGMCFGLKVGSGAFVFARGGWTTVDIYVALNSPGSQDGVMAVAINGTTGERGAAARGESGSTAGTKRYAVPGEGQTALFKDFQLWSNSKPNPAHAARLAGPSAGPASGATVGSISLRSWAGSAAVAGHARQAGMPTWVALLGAVALGAAGAVVGSAAVRWVPAWSTSPRHQPLQRSDSA